MLIKTLPIGALQKSKQRRRRTARSNHPDAITFPVGIGRISRAAFVENDGHFLVADFPSSGGAKV
jgi:hypothetical protein